MSPLPALLFVSVAFATVSFALLGTARASVEGTAAGEAGSRWPLRPCGNEKLEQGCLLGRTSQGRAPMGWMAQGRARRGGRVASERDAAGE